jgi:hypothetical protein
VRRAIALAAAIAVVAGCGNPGGDLIAIEEHGGPAGAQRLVVTDDGRGSCNGGELKRLPSERLLEAREAERNLQGLPGKDRLDFGRLPGRTIYTARMRGAEVTWSEGARQPPVLPKTTLLALKLRNELCPAIARAAP